MSADLTNPIFTDETKAREYLEQVRWPTGPYCPYCPYCPKCGSTEGQTRMEGKTTRPGLHKCNACQAHYSVTMGTVYERSHIPLHKWLLATHLLTSGKKGVSAHQIHRMLGITYKSAWFMCHRIREGMKGANPGTMGGPGQVVEADETYIGPSGLTTDAEGKPQRKRGYGDKRKIVSLVERGGRVRSVKVDNVTAKQVGEILLANVDRKSALMTDEANHYRTLGKTFASHGTTQHAKGEYAKTGGIHTNTVEGYFSIFERGMKGVYQHCSEQHLQRYLNEFDFRYSNRSRLGVEDVERHYLAVKGITGKRLTYRRPIRLA